MKRIILIVVSLMLFQSCASTPYSGVSAGQLTDDQLIVELYAAYSQLGKAQQNVAYLNAIKPSPSYVLRGMTSSQWTGSAHALGNNVYGNASGISSSTYWMEDQNALARSINSLASFVESLRAQNLARRVNSLEAEADHRIRERQEKQKQLVEDFFARNPDLKERQMLVACVAPWVADEDRARSLEEVLPIVAERVRKMIKEDYKNDYSGVWYGVLVQTTTLANGEKINIVDYVRMDMSHERKSLQGNGLLLCKHKLAFAGQLEGAKFTGSVSNISAGLNAEFSCVAAPTQISGSFAGSGAGQTFIGTVTIVR